MKVRVGCQFTYDADVATHAVVQVEPRLTDGVLALEERWSNTAQVGMSRYLDAFGNWCRRTTIPPGGFSMSYDALLEVPDRPDRQNVDACEVAPVDLPDDALVFTLPSRFCPSRGTRQRCLDPVRIVLTRLATSAGDLRLGPQ